MSELFQRNKSTLSRHIKNVFEEGELNPDATVAFFATVQTEGKRKVERDIAYMISLKNGQRMNWPLLRFISWKVLRKSKRNLKEITTRSSNSFFLVYFFFFVLQMKKDQIGPKYSEYLLYFCSVIAWWLAHSAVQPKFSSHRGNICEKENLGDWLSKVPVPARGLQNSKRQTFLLFLHSFSKNVVYLQMRWQTCTVIAFVIGEQSPVCWGKWHVDCRRIWKIRRKLVKMRLSLLIIYSSISAVSVVIRYTV